jgi:hypothetical protein
LRGLDPVKWPGELKAPPSHEDWGAAMRRGRAAATGYGICDVIVVGGVLDRQASSRDGDELVGAGV